jgi:hypothetical protein
MRRTAIVGIRDAMADASLYWLVERSRSAWT